MDFGINNIVFIILFFVAVGFLTKNVLKLISYLKIAKADNRFNNIGARIKNTLINAILQKKILRDKKAGLIHAGIFWGFLILLFSVINSIFTGFGIHDFLNYLGPIFTAITLLTDIFILLIISAVLIALLRRFVFKVQRLHREGHSQGEAGLILLMIFTIVISLFFENASLIALNNDSTWAFRPVSNLLAGLIPLDYANIIYQISWWIHILVILAFMNFLPYSKHLHVLSSVINVYFANLNPNNSLKSIDFEDEDNEMFGVTDIEDFSWKTLLDSYTCTECGRCTDVCPANTTGKVLDPREIMVQIRKRTLDRAPILIKLKEQEKTVEDYTEAELSEDENAIMEKTLIGDYVNPDALWQCTSCSACMEECPVLIEHVPAIIDMRRSLVMMESEFPNELQTPFNNIENNSSPWAFSPDSRADWTEGTNVKEAGEKEEFDVLFWVGCAGSYDDRAKNISISFAALMEKAGINFAILGKEEQCTGDPARRAGNEYLANSFIEMNVETMNNYKFNKVVATCPHCFNTLKNEYPMFGGNYDVVHHTDFIKDLLDSGKITVKDTVKEEFEITYHDSCYIGRLNGIYNQPRQSLMKLPGLKILEAERNKDKGLCCGAGGAQMFMEETEGKRINIERTEELLATGSKTIAVNCPFCMTMITDGVKEKESDVKVKDISEIILEQIK